MNPNYLLTLDPASAARIARLMAASTTAKTFYLSAMRFSVTVVTDRTKANAASRFKAPTGNLLGNIQGVVISPWLGVVGATNNVAYARRREFGFSGMTDSLGRYYPDDPGAFYLRDGLNDSRADIEGAFMAATTMQMRSIALP